MSDEPSDTSKTSLKTIDLSDDTSTGSQDHWDDIRIDLDELHKIVCEVFRVPPSQCGPPVRIGQTDQTSYARAYSFQLPTRKVVARLVYPTQPLFKTESEVAAMNFVRSRTSLPVPQVFSYCSEDDNPVGVEWLIMEHMPGVTMDEAWDDLGFPQRKRLALDIIDLYDQLYQLKADGCGSIYHSINLPDSNCILGAKEQRPARWKPLSKTSLSLLKSLCDHSIHDDYTLGPLNDGVLIDYLLPPVPSPTATRPVFSSHEYVKLLALKGNPTTRPLYYSDIPTREKCLELFQNIYKLYPSLTAFGPSADSSNFRFSHGDLHEGNILVDPATGAITSVIDWEAAAFRPLWSVIGGIGWFEEDRERFVSKDSDSDNPPANFSEDTGPHDAELRAFFRTEMNKRNPDLFSCFLGAIELRAVLSAAVDLPIPYSDINAFLIQYHETGCWNENRRGAFPWDMMAWRIWRLSLDEMEEEKAFSVHEESILQLKENPVLDKLGESTATQRP